PTEKTLTNVSCVHATVCSTSRQPPHTSATIWPSTISVADAPSSPCCAKFSASASRSASKRGSQVPWTSTSVELEQLGLLGRELRVGERARAVQLGQALEAVDLVEVGVAARGGRGRPRGGAVVARRRAGAAALAQEPEDQRRDGAEDRADDRH